MVMILITITEQLMKTMFLDYQSLTVVILVSTFELLLVAMVKETVISGIVLVLLMEVTVLLLLLVTAIIVNQLLGIVEIITHIFLMTHYGTEWDVQIIVVMTLHNLGSIVN